jgi:hypothetical protein
VADRYGLPARYRRAKPRIGQPRRRRPTIRLTIRADLQPFPPRSAGTMYLAASQSA